MLRRLFARFTFRKVVARAFFLKLPRKDWAVAFESKLRISDFSAAEGVCRQRILQEPEDRYAWHSLGRVLTKSGDFAQARMALMRSLRFGDASADLLCDIANLCRIERDSECALRFYAQALTVDPSHESSLQNIAHLKLEIGDLVGALFHWRHLHSFSPYSSNLSKQIASILTTQESYAEAIIFLKEALEQDPTNTNLLGVLGFSYAKLGRLELAREAYLQALQFDPKDALVANNLGYLYFQLGKVRQAIPLLDTATSLNQEFFEAWNNLAIALHREGEIERAEATLKRALAIQPEYGAAHTNLGKLYLEQGALSQAEYHFRQGVSYAPESPNSYSNLLLCMNYSRSVTLKELYGAHIDWSRTYAHKAPLQHRNGPGIGARRLRIGYVSADFITHSVSFFIEPILREHDRNEFEVYCYSNNLCSDKTTMRLKALGHQWRDINCLTDKLAAELIQRDKIDILVDLAGHTAGNRLVLMSMKPAPLQVTYLGYPNTTGLSAIDYRITDTLADTALAQTFYTEKLYRMERCFLCYQPPINSPAVERDDGLDPATIYFSAFNNLAKVTDQMLRLWAEILRILPESKLMLPSSAVQGGCGGLWRQRLASHGIETRRVEWLGRAPTVSEHLTRYNLVDIALDTYPYNGTTTTMDALWMGVPVVSLSGEVHASRVGRSILSRLSLTQCIAKSEAEYIAAACELASAGPRSTRLRQELRLQVCQSELLDAGGMTIALENFYRTAWRDWRKL